MKKSNKILGIDLGTTNSCVAIIVGGRPQIIENQDGGRTTPSVLTLDKEGHFLVGIRAKRQILTNPNTVSSIKRLIGKTQKIKIGEKEYTPEQISAEILRYIKSFAERKMGMEFTKAVITVPAYFNSVQREATKNAGKIAGLEVMRIINEPTAAALAYGIDKADAEQKILVFDLGGGTFDVSFLEISKGTFEVIATDGDNNLGGDDFDEKIVQYLLKEFKKENGIDLGKDKLSLQRFKDAAEKAKIELSETDQTTISIPFVAQNENGPLHLEIKLTQAKFELLVADLLLRAEKKLIELIKTSKFDPSKINHILLVGGSTKMPMISRLIEKKTGKKPSFAINPDEAVAIGAAIQAGILQGDVKDILLLDVISLSLGIETLGGVKTTLIERNTTVPASRSQVFSTASDGQPSVDIHVLQGERKFAKDNKTLGRFQLADIGNAPRGTPQIEVTFDIDENQIVSVKAKDLKTNKEQSIVIKDAGSLSEDEIKRMIDEAEANKKADEQRFHEIGLTNQAETIVYQIEKILTMTEKENKEKKMKKEDLAAAETSKKELTDKKEFFKKLIVDKNWTELEIEIKKWNEKMKQAEDFVKKSDSDPKNDPNNSPTDDNSQKSADDVDDVQPKDSH